MVQGSSWRGIGSFTTSATAPSIRSRDEVRKGFGLDGVQPVDSMGVGVREDLPQRRRLCVRGCGSVCQSSSAAS